MCENPYRPEPYKILGITQETEIESTFRVETDLKPVFGQFFQVSIPRVGESPFSISGVGDGWLDFTIRRVGKVTGSLHQMKAGDTLFIRGPYGNGFPIEDFKGKHLIIAAGGCGLSPLRPLIEYFYNHPHEIERLDIMMGFKSPDDILFKEDVRRWRTRFETIITVDYPKKTWADIHVGLITKFVKEIELSEFSKMEIVIVGPPLMMKYTALEFLNRGIPRERIVVSYERRMSCGLGKCGHCKIDDTYVCTDGPIYRYDKAYTLMD